MLGRLIKEKKNKKQILQKYINREILQEQLPSLLEMKEEAQEELLNHLIPFWKKMRDDEFGGYYGEMSYDLVVHKTANKSCSSTLRLLGFFSVCYWNLKDASLLEEAKHAYEFLTTHFVDQEQGGLYHMLDYQGNVVDDSKYTHELALAIYSLAVYYDCTKEEAAIDLARNLYDLIETACRDEIGYIPAFERNFEKKESHRFSKKGIPASRTMHTLVHVLEGYTGLLKVLKSMKSKGNISEKDDVWANHISDSMKKILDIIEGKVYNHELGRQEAFFDDQYHSIIDLHPYGYDIETAWLIDQSTDVLNDKEYQQKMGQMTSKLVKTIYNTAFDGNSVDNECEEGLVDSRRTMWVQTEAVLGFLNSFIRNNEKTEYADAARNEWEFIKKYMIDSREGSEWFDVVSKDGKPDETAKIVDAYKCPYHNGRMCLEIIYRINQLEESIA